MTRVLGLSLADYWRVREIPADVGMTALAQSQNEAEDSKDGVPMTDASLLAGMIGKRTVSTRGK